MQVYILDGWMYMSSLFGTDSSWLKSPATTDALDVWGSQDQLAQQIEFLKTAVQTDSAGSEKVNGIDCYVLKIGPDLDSLSSWLSSQDEDGLFGSMDSTFTDLFDNVTVKIWVAKSTFLPVKETLEMTMTASPQDFDPSSTETGSITMTATATINYYDYNQPLAIVLPPEAAAAIDLSSSYNPFTE